jgi:hypothetical protein
LENSSSDVSTKQKVIANIYFDRAGFGAKKHTNLNDARQKQINSGAISLNASAFLP